VFGILAWGVLNAGIEKRYHGALFSGLCEIGTGLIYAL
jgi:hypothetical protein